MKAILLTSCLCLLLSACSSTKTEPVAAAAANLNSTTAAKTTEKTAADPKVAQVTPKLICQTEFTIGSRFPKKVCRTSEQIEQQKEESRKTMDTLRYLAPGQLSGSGNG